MNPVTRRELQERFRTLRSPVLLSAWVLAAGALTFLAYLVARAAAEANLEGSGAFGLSSLFASSSMGRFILHTLLLGLLTAVIFIVPGQAAVAVVGERERQTLALLQVSQLSAWRIVAGKLMSALAYVLLLLVATTPLLVIPVLLGGVTIWNVIAGMVMVIGASVMIGSVAIWISARARSIQGAVLGSYVATVILVFGTMALLVAEVFLVGPNDLGPTRFQGGLPRDDGRELYSAHVNPFIGLVDASSNPIDFTPEVVPSPYLPFRSVLVKRQGYAGTAVTSTNVGFAVGREEFFFEGAGFVEPIPASFQQQNRVGEPIRPSVWPTTLLFELALSGVALAGATALVKAPRGRIRLIEGRNGSAS